MINEKFVPFAKPRTSTSSEDGADNSRRVATCRIALIERWLNNRKGIIGHLGAGTTAWLLLSLAPLRVRFTMLREESRARGHKRWVTGCVTSWARAGHTDRATRSGYVHRCFEAL